MRFDRGDGGSTLGHMAICPYRRDGAGEDVVMDFDAALGEAVCPVLVEANLTRVVQEAKGVLLASEEPEFGIVRIVGGDEGVFAMKDRGIAGAGVGSDAYFSGVNGDLDTEFQGGVGVVVEVRIDEIRQFRLVEMEFDQSDARSESVVIRALLPVVEMLAGVMFNLLEEGMQ